MWAWIGEFLLLYLIWYYICYEFTPYMALGIWHFCRWKTKVYYFCRKIIQYGISVAKISTYALPGQTLEEITNIFHQFNAWKLMQYYRDILHHFELSWNYRDNRKKHYRSGVMRRGPPLECVCLPIMATRDRHTKWRTDFCTLINTSITCCTCNSD